MKRVLGLAKPSGQDLSYEKVNLSMTGLLCNPRIRRIQLAVSNSNLEEILKFEM